MTPEELEQKRKSLGYSKQEMAKRLRVDYSTYWRWCKGERDIPGIAEVALDGIAFKEANRTTR